MTHEQQALWHRIRDFSFDAPNASLPYSVRLAREQDWTPVFAQRVVDEYRRFAFLSVVAGHGVTPSKAVDEAWHLHLLYTRNYWERFCPQILGRSLHHHPADGGEEDDLKYEGWYEATLASYERLFGFAPPADIWPRATQPAPIKRRLLPWFGMALLPLVLSGCDEPANPLDWHGPPFLQLFAILCLVALSLALLVRLRLRIPDRGPPAEEWRLHVYEEACLNGGETLALKVAVARLTASGQLELDRKRGRFRATEGTVGKHPVDRAILRAATGGSGCEYATLQRTTCHTLDEIGTSLRRQGLWVSPAQARRAVLVPHLVAGLPLLLGGAKILVGLSRERPVVFLALGCVAALALNLYLLQPPERSRYGDAVLDALRRRYRPTSPSASSADDLAMGMALFGVGVLANTPYAYLQASMVPPSTADGSGGGDSGSTSSCGSSSCGGGGCGGGCGGCGS